MVITAYVYCQNIVPRIITWALLGKHSKIYSIDILVLFYIVGKRSCHNPNILPVRPWSPPNKTSILHFKISLFKWSSWKWWLTGIWLSRISSIKGQDRWRYRCDWSSSEWNNSLKNCSLWYILTSQHVHSQVSHQGHALPPFFIIMILGLGHEIIVCAMSFYIPILYHNSIILS